MSTYTTPDPTATAIDVESVRADTEGCAHVVHLNNAGAALPPRQVIDAVIEHLRHEARTGGYEAADEHAGAVAHTYDAVARLIGAGPGEIALTESATRAWDTAFHAVPLRPGDRVLTSRAEYGSSVISFLRFAEERGVSVEVVPDDEHGQLDTQALAGMLDERVRLVAVTHVPTSNGLVNPAEEIGRVLRGSDAADALYLLDACQSAGQLPLDVGAIGCDMLSATGRKYLRAPRGTGFLYCSERALKTLEPPFADVRSADWTGERTYELRPDAQRFESWESSVAGRIGLGRAVDYALALGIDAVRARIAFLADGLRGRLAELPGVRVCDTGAVRSGIVTFVVDGHESDTVKARLHERAINVWTTNLASGRWDLEARGLHSTVRASVHYYNIEAELDALCGAIAEL